MSQGYHTAGGFDDIAVQDAAAIVFVSSGNNKLKASGLITMIIDPTYTLMGGVAYTFAGPASASVLPRRLGFKKGDKVTLSGALGSEPNHGRTLTIVNPSLLSFKETLTIPDPNAYSFTVTRRSL